MNLLLLLIRLLFGNAWATHPELQLVPAASRRVCRGLRAPLLHYSWLHAARWWLQGPLDPQKPNQKLMRFDRYLSCLPPKGRACHGPGKHERVTRLIRDAVG